MDDGGWWGGVLLFLFDVLAYICMRVWMMGVKNCVCLGWCAWDSSSIDMQFKSMLSKDYSK